MPTEEEPLIVVTDELGLASPGEKRNSYPRLGGGKQKTFQLTARITRYVVARSERHGVSQAEVVRSMLNERIDYEEMMERAHYRTVSDERLAA